MAASGVHMGAGSIDHMPQVVEFMTECLFVDPTLLACPLVGMGRIDGARRVEIAVGLLCRSHDVEHAVYIGSQSLVGIGLENIAGSFDGLIHVGIVERITHELRHVPFGSRQSLVSGMLERIGCHLEILVAMLARAFAECQGDGYLMNSLEPIAPKGVGQQFYLGKRHLIERVANGISLPCFHRQKHGQGKHHCGKSSFKHK